MKKYLAIIACAATAHAQDMNPWEYRANVRDQVDYLYQTQVRQDRDADIAARAQLIMFLWQQSQQQQHRRGGIDGYGTVTGSTIGH